MGRTVAKIRNRFEIIHLMGTMTDVAIAKKFKVSINSVAYERRHRKIPRYQISVSDNPRFDESFFNRLGKISDTILGLQYDVSRQRVEQIRNKLGIRDNRRRQIKRLEKAMLPWLGKLSIPKLRQRFSVSNFLIRRLQKKYNIPTPPREPKATPQKNKVLGAQKLLGVLRDTKIARKLNVSCQTVGRIRRELGIMKVKKIQGL